MPRNRSHRRKRIKHVVIRRKPNQAVSIGGGIIVKVLRLTATTVELGVDAPGLDVVRPEVGA